MENKIRYKCIILPRNKNHCVLFVDLIQKVFQQTISGGNDRYDKNEQTSHKNNCHAK